MGLRRILAEEGLTGSRWQDYFAPDAEGLSKRSWKHFVVEMSPQDFLTLALPGRSEEKENGVASLIQSGTKFNSIPTLSVEMKKNKQFVVEHEGRHRARALQTLGVASMPVLIEVYGTTWYSGDAHLVFDQATRAKKKVLIRVP